MQPTGKRASSTDATTWCGFEVYDGGRYFTLTGHRVPGTPPTINDRQDQMAWLVATFVDSKTTEHRECETRRDHGHPPDDADTARSALAALNPTRAENYTDWLNVGMALHSVGGDLLGDWDHWSKQSPKWSDGVCERKWRSFSGKGVGIGTLVYLAKQDGWTPTRSARPATTPPVECSSAGVKTSGYSARVTRSTFFCTNACTPTSTTTWAESTDVNL